MHVQNNSGFIGKLVNLVDTGMRDKLFICLVSINLSLLFPKGKGKPFLGKPFLSCPPEKPVL
jgi:hypothetical protein